MTRRDDEPTFFALDYVTITRDPRTQLVVAIGGDPRAAGILQTADGFHSAPSAGRDYHRLPHHMPVEHQRHGHLDEAAKKQLATHAVPWLHKAGYMVHITDDVWDSAAYTDAATAMRNQNVPAPPPAVAAARTTERPPVTRRR